MSHKPLSRRTLLRGLGGAAVALPMLEVMLPRRIKAADAPKHFLVCFAGQSLGTTHDLFVPSIVGRGYDLKEGLAPLATFAVQDEVSVVSGLEIPWGSHSAGTIPPAGRDRVFHSPQMPPLLTGARPANRQKDYPSAPSADQLVAESLAATTTFPTLAYRVQASRYRDGGPASKARMSYRQSGTRIDAVEPVSSPNLAYSSLFGSFSSEDPEVEAQRRFNIDRRRSILDFVDRHQRTRLTSRLTASDRQRIERHFDEIRALEKKLEARAPKTDATCYKLPDPGPDPAIGGNGKDNVDGGYSNEEARAELMSDLLHMAFTCDMTRSASLMLTFEQCFMMMDELSSDYPSDLHQMSHQRFSGHSIPRQIAFGLAWHVKHFAYLVSKLRDTPDGLGGNLLDHMAIVMLFEGGRGHDPETGKSASPHSTENMAALIAGRAGGLAPGQHVVAKGMHPCHVTTSAMSAVGVSPRLGEVDGRISSLFS